MVPPNRHTEPSYSWTNCVVAWSRFHEMEVIMPRWLWFSEFLLQPHTWSCKDQTAAWPQNTTEPKELEPEPTNIWRKRLMYTFFFILNPHWRAECVSLSPHSSKPAGKSSFEWFTLQESYISILKQSHFLLIMWQRFTFRVNTCVQKRPR